MNTQEKRQVRRGGVQQKVAGVQQRVALVSYLRLDDDEHLDPLLLHASPPPACRLLFEPFPQPDCIESSELL